MIYSVTGWFKIVQYNYKQEATMENLEYQGFICINIRPGIIMYDCKNKFLRHEFLNLF